jgi:OmpA-OmpF porin, OOP family
MWGCQPSRWVWGLLPLAGLWLVSGVLNHDRIEADLAARATAGALKAAAPWASATFEGRDGVLAGVAPGPSEREAAQVALASLPGVRLVRDAATILAEDRPYRWTATRDGARLTLAGSVPTEEARAKLLAEARSATAGATIVDEMKLARGAPPTYEAAATYALAQLARLPDGKATLTDATLALSGTASSAEAHQAAVAAAQPQGVATTVSIGLPIARPYVWQAEKQGRSVILTGHAPSAEARARIVAAAGAVGSVQDRMTLAAGAPPGFEAMAEAALGHVGGLDNGSASLSDAAYSLSGAAPSYEGYVRATEAAKALPQGFTLASAAINAPVVDPYTWSATREEGVLTLSGNVPGEEARASILAAASAAVPGARIVDRQQPNLGAPQGFAAMAAEALAQLGRLRSGAASLSGTRYALTGVAPTVAARDQAAAATAALPAGFTLERQDISAAPVSPYTWSASRNGDTVTLAGHVPDDEARAANAAAARAAVPGAAIEDRQTLAAGAPQGFAGAAAFAIARLAGLDPGEASLTDATLSVTGRAGTLAARNAAVAGLSDLPAGYSLGRQEIVAPRITPYVWSAAREGETVTLAGHVPDEATRAATLAAVRTALPQLAVVDRQVLGAGAPEGFAGMTALALRQLGRLEAGTVSLTNSAYAITGRAGTPAVRDELVAGLLRLPAGFSLSRQEITAPSPPPPPPAAVVVPPPPPPPLPVVGGEDRGAAGLCQNRLDALLVEPILFDTAEATIRPVSYALLGRLAEAVKGCPGRTIEIGAHTDAEGAEDRNQALSERRAQAVVDFLEREGVPATAMRAIGYGQTRPIAPNDTAENKQKNRRVEFLVK